jgi:hypothetical protein
MLLGSPGGVLFEYHVLLYGASKDCDQLLLALEKKENKYDPFSTYVRYASHFWFVAACALYKVNRQCSLPLMHLTLQLEYRGLSRMGRSLAAHFGAAPKLRNYDIKKSQLVKAFTTKVRNKVTNNEGVVTWDNYCHVYGSPTLSTSRTTGYQKANFTVVGHCRNDFKKRPIFCWKTVDDIWASLPRNPADLMPFGQQVQPHILYR